MATGQTQDRLDIACVAFEVHVKIMEALLFLFEQFLDSLYTCTYSTFDTKHQIVVLCFQSHNHSQVVTVEWMIKKFPHIFIQSKPLSPSITQQKFHRNKKSG